MQVVLDTRGLQLSVKNHCFFIEAENESRLIHPSRVGSFLVTAPCRISSPALILAAENQVPVIICNNCGKPEARIWSSRFINTSALRRGQYRFSQQEQGLLWAADMIRLKIDGQKANLQYLANRRPAMAELVRQSVESIVMIVNQFTEQVETSEVILKKHILSMEAYSAARYWAIAGTRLPTPFTFSIREKRHPADAFNAGINYLYGMLRNEAETAVLSVGLDPALGVIHRDGYRLPSLVFDMMEPFRPVMDRLMLAAIFDNYFKPDDFEAGATGYLITKSGRKSLISLFTKRLYGRVQFRGNLTTLKNQILNEAKRLTVLIRKP